MNAFFRTRTLRDSLLLLLWGVFVLGIAFSGQLSTYLHPSLQPYTVIAGVLLLVLALFPLRSHRLSEPENHHDHGSHDHDHDSCCHHHEHGDDHNEHQPIEAPSSCCDGNHSHSHGRPALGSLIFKTLILLLPLAVVVSGKSNLYTLNTISNRGVVQDIASLPAAKASTQPTGGGQAAADEDAEKKSSQPLASMPIQVIDLLYAVQMPSYREEFEGKEVEMVGQFVPLTVGNPKGNRFQIIRLFITCCAADAKPVGVTVQYDKPLKASEMGWFKITGKPTFPMEGGRRTAVLVANKVEECAAPAEPFVY